MSIVKTGKHYEVRHCHGKKRGQVIAKHETKKQAMAQHRAIQANKKRGK